MVNKYTDVEAVSAMLNGVSISGSTTPSDDVVDNWIKEASSEIELMTNKVWTSTTASSVLLDYDGTGYLRLPNAPVISITSLEYNKQGFGSDSNDWVSMTQGYNDDYILYGDSEVKFYTAPAVGTQRLRVTYVYGYSSVPLWIKKQATRMVARQFIASVVQGDAKEQGGSVTVGNISISDPTTFSSDFLRKLDADIEDTFSKHVNQTHVFRPSRNYSNGVR